MIKQNISKGIKEARWIKIDYLNSNNEVTTYWIAVKDINIEEQALVIDAFNISFLNEENNVVISISILFKNIMSAEVISNTSYEQPEELIEKINRYIEELEWLGYDAHNEAKLDYIEKCMIHESVAYQKETTLIQGVDQIILEEEALEKEYKLTGPQAAHLVEDLETLNKQDQENRQEIVTLAINYLSINTKNHGPFVVAYRELTFDPKKRSLVLGSSTLFNYDFSSVENKEFKHNLHNYLDVETDEFTELFLADKKAAKNMLHEEVVKRKESLDSVPRIFELRRTNTNHIIKEIDQIKRRKNSNDLPIPLNAFFGNNTKNKETGMNKHIDVIVLDEQANIDQLRAIYNALRQPITYVQGPPGTGKTATIINILISAFFNKQKVLVASNNNKPINDILLKLRGIKDKQNRTIHLPFLRLGKKEEILKVLDWLKDLLPRIKNYTIDEEKLTRHAVNKRELTEKINSYLSTYERRIELEEQIDILNVTQSLITEEFGIKTKIYADIDKYKQERALLPEINEIMFHDQLRKVDERFLTWLFFNGIKHFKLLFQPRFSDLLQIIEDDNNEERLKAFNKYLANDEKFALLQTVFPIILTTNHSAHKLGSQDAHFNLTIIDEAGQCAIGPSLFAIARAERLLLVGDQEQLKPVITIPSETNKALMKKYEIGSNYDYLENSILSTMQKVDTLSKVVMLTSHYRSRKSIIGYSNTKYYNNLLKVLTKEKEGLPPGLVFIDAKSNYNAPMNQKNIAPLEINAIIENIKKNKPASVGIITPFRNQADTIKAALDNEKIPDVDVGTIHTFQGDEKEVIYFSPAITRQTREKTFEWVKNNKQLLNVAATRAKTQLVIVCDEAEITRRSHYNNDLNDLVKYVKNNGVNVELSTTIQDPYMAGANYRNHDTQIEKAFLETISHLLTTFNNDLTVKAQVPMKNILDRFTSPEKYDYGMRAVFDFVIFKKKGELSEPVLVVEVNGSEHYHDDKVIQRDNLKEKICHEHGIKIEKIVNSFARRYYSIRDLFIKTLKI